MTTSMKKRARTDWLVVHCSATPGTLDVGRTEIDRWHRQKGWLMIGYHLVIRRNGAVEKGRDIDVLGAHVEGHNSNSIGICMVGGTDAKGNPQDNFTSAQYETLASVLRDLHTKYPDAQVCGHRDFSPDKNRDGKITPNEWIKACPSFDVHEWMRTTGLFVKRQPLPVVPTDTAQPGWKYREIVAGDTLSSLARTNSTTVDAIIALNPKSNLKVLKIGTSVRVL